MTKDQKENLRKKADKFLNSPFVNAYIIGLIAIYPIQFVTRVIFNKPINSYEYPAIGIIFIVLLIIDVMQLILLDRYKNIIKQYQNDFDDIEHIFDLAERFQESYAHAAKINKNYIEVSDELKKINDKLIAENRRLILTIASLENKHGQKT